jgi:hypothetical protein
MLDNSKDGICESVQNCTVWGCMTPGFRLIDAQRFAAFMGGVDCSCGAVACPPGLPRLVQPCGAKTGNFIARGGAMRKAFQTYLGGLTNFLI